MSERRAHDIAQAKAARLLQKRTGSVSSSENIGPAPPHTTPRRHARGGYAASVSTVVSRMDPHHLDDDILLSKPMQYENTYRMAPKKKFPTSRIEAIISDALTSYLHPDIEYEPEHCRDLTKTISEVIKARVKETVLPRYKIVCVVNIGQVNSQGLRMGSRCLWNAEHDTFASASFKNGSVFAVGNVYGIYYE
ncbi:dynein light chain Tctex-type 5-B-like [Styela clava]|uniref:tctex1 domain-containing protein 1-B-like n=1 Tax=Styela clava TaxID=7725 RepID=UPI00193AB23B|nr:tctex1 domain-containing protein 1-B-like [Styela clava]XP_039258282.1 tctex1 domain-containing protein 1-B-like [Styela clava]